MSFGSSTRTGQLSGGWVVAATDNHENNKHQAQGFQVPSSWDSIGLLTSYVTGTRRHGQQNGKAGKRAGREAER